MMSVTSVRATPPPTPRPSTPRPPEVPVNFLTRHRKYYLEDGVVFLVEDTLFKVPRYLFVKESPVFADMFAMPQAAVQSLEGLTDAAPIQLLQVTSIDFERILAILYPLDFDGLEATAALWGRPEWTSVLELATRWQMHKLRDMAIARLTTCSDPVSKVSLGRLYDYPLWIREGFCALCLRDESLMMSEIMRLSKEDIFRIAEAREKIRAQVLPLKREPKRWFETKYGECLVGSTNYRDSARYAKHMMVQVILDDVFGLSDIPEIDDEISRT